MIKFNKLFGYGILSVTIVIMFLSTAITAYPSIISKENSLRVPIGKEGGMFQRM